jgi:hypothetical protein
MKQIKLHLPSLKSASIAISGGSEANAGDVGKYIYMNDTSSSHENTKE